MEENYDRLSLMGEDQARRLGTFLAGRKAVFDVVYTGPRKRQVDTARITGESYRESGLPWPETVTLPELDEYEAEFLVKESLPRLLQTHDHVRKLFEGFQTSNGRPHQEKSFQRMFEAVMKMWVRGEFEFPGVEPWPKFRDRVRAGIDRIMRDSGRSQRVIAFTSVFPISAAVHFALETSPETTLEIGWKLRNTSLTEFLFTEDRFSLNVFNSLPHLDDPSQWTYR